jgi:hypothetical protein
VVAAEKHRQSDRCYPTALRGCCAPARSSLALVLSSSNIGLIIIIIIGLIILSGTRQRAQRAWLLGWALLARAGTKQREQVAVKPPAAQQNASLA